MPPSSKTDKDSPRKTRSAAESAKTPARRGRPRVRKSDEGAAAEAREPSKGPDMPIPAAPAAATHFDSDHVSPPNPPPQSS